MTETPKKKNPAVTSTLDVLPTSILSALEEEHDDLPVVVSPGGESETEDCNSDDDDSVAVNPIVKTAHKLAEERGFEHEEPLLKENPKRFVLFPIQDDEVSDADNAT